MKILVIDDEESTRDLLKLSLAADGYNVLLAEDGYKGLDIYEEERPEIVLVDIKMPGMDGIEVLRRIKAQHAPTEVIVITGHGEMNLAIDALQLDASDFINKPITDKALQVAIRRAKEKLWMRNTLEDYTHRLEMKVKDAVEELTKRHELEHKLVQASIDGIIVNDRRGNVIIFNEGSERIYGYRAGEVIGKINVKDLYPPGMASKIRRLMLSDQYGPPGELTNYETTVLAKDGTHVPVLLSGRPMYEDGKEVAAVGYFKDMREIKGLQRMTSELVQASIDGIIVNDRRGNVIIFNEGSERIYGYRAEEVIGKINVRDLYPHGLAKEVKRLVMSDEYGPPGELSNYETAVLGKDGAHVPVLLSARTLVLGDEVMAVGYFKDMREVKRLQEELLESERMAAMGRTVASIAHGIKNILHSMNLGAYLLDLGLKKDDSEILTKGWGLVRNNINRVSKLVMDMLSFSSEKEPKLQPTDPNELMDSVIDLYAERAKAAGIEVVRKYDDFPEPVMVDPGGIENCLVNLFTNAIEAFSEDTKERRIVLTTKNLKSVSDPMWQQWQRERGDIVEFEVEDNAGGLSEDAKKTIFKEIYSTKGAKGTGLGLYITKKCVEEHRGRIDWSTTKGVGTVFIIRLPNISPEKD